MTDTKGTSSGSVIYQRADVAPNIGEDISKTNGETPTQRVTIVPRIEDEIRLRIVPQSPRQRGGQVQTD
jgi:hypothetical protein